MPYRIHPEVDAAEFERHSGNELQYIADLKERGLLFEIDNIAVDAEQLVLRTFQCNTNYCVRCVGSHSDKEYKGSCCTDLQVDLARREYDKLVEMARTAKRRLKFNKTDPIGQVVDRVLQDKTTKMTDENELVFLHKRNGACVMSYMDKTGQFRCSINSLCEMLDLPVPEYKPAPCFMFPLHYSEYRKNHYLVSVLCAETQYWIEQHTDVGKLRCLRKPEPGAPPAYQSLRYEIEHVLGKKFYRELDRRAEPLLAEYQATATTNGARA